MAFCSGCQQRHSPVEASAENLEEQEKRGMAACTSLPTFVFSMFLCADLISAGEHGFDAKMQTSLCSPSGEAHHEGAGLLDNHMPSVDVRSSCSSSLRL